MGSTNDTAQTVWQALRACLECLKPMMPKDARDRLDRRTLVEGGATFQKKSHTIAGFSLSSTAVLVWVQTASTDSLAVVWRPASDTEATGTEIRAGDIKAIEASGAKSIIVTSRRGEILLEIEATDEAFRDRWVKGLNEVVLKNMGDTTVDGLSGQPKTLKERAEKELYFQKRQMEMQAAKKVADERKAKYMKEAGGLKYTALAMANK